MELLVIIFVFPNQTTAMVRESRARSACVRKELNYHHVLHIFSVLISKCGLGLEVDEGVTF